MSQMIVEMTSEEARLLRGMQKLIAEQKKMEDGFSKVGRSGKKAGDDAGKALEKTRKHTGPSAQQELSAMALRWGSVAGGIALATAALNKYQAERQKMGGQLLAESFGMSELAQLAGGDAAKLKQLIGEVRKTQRETGASAQEASQLQFTLESLGAGKSREFFAGFRKITDPMQLAEGASTLQSAFGVEETGDIQAVANKLFAASAVSKARLQEFAPAATIAAQQQAKLLGGSDEELLGTMAILSRATKSADMASTQIRSLATSLAEQGLGGQGLLAAVSQAEEMMSGMTASEKIKFMGRQEALTGFYGIQQNRAEIESTIRDVERAATSGLGGRMQASVREVRELEAVRQFEISEQKKMIEGGGEMGVEQLGRERAKNEIETRSMENKELWTTRAFRQQINEWGDKGNLPEWAIRTLNYTTVSPAEMLNQTFRTGDPTAAFEQAHNAYQSDMSAAARDLREAAAAMKESATMNRPRTLGRPDDDPGR